MELIMHLAGLNSTTASRRNFTFGIAIAFLPQGFVFNDLQAAGAPEDKTDLENAAKKPPSNDPTPLPGGPHPTPKKEVEPKEQTVPISDGAKKDQ